VRVENDRHPTAELNMKIIIDANPWERHTSNCMVRGEKGNRVKQIKKSKGKEKADPIEC
jgi:hypothetical protein